MKRFLSVCAVAVLALGVARAETDYVAMPVIRDIQKGTDNANQIEDLRVKADAVIGDDLAVGGAVTVGSAMTVGGDLSAGNLSTAILAARSDTNAVTLVASYTPRRVGDVLVGYADGSNWVWIARGTTTNDWQQIAP